MKFATIPRQNLSLDTELLVRFALRRLSEIESDQTEPPQVVMALALAAAFQEKEFHDRLKEDVTSSSENAEDIMGMSQGLFVPVIFGQPVELRIQTKRIRFLRSKTVNQSYTTLLARERESLLKGTLNF